MGLLDKLMEMTAEVDADQVEEELSELLLEDETVDRAYAVVDGLFLFTNRRLLLADKQGMTDQKVKYRSVPYHAVSQFNVETAGRFDADAALLIHVTGGVAPIRKEFGEKSNVLEIQRTLAERVLR